MSSKFQPTRPLRGATRSSRRTRTACSYFNPRAPCGARPQRSGRRGASLEISTHAPLAGRDPSRRITWSRPLIFQPTRPLRGATDAAADRWGTDCDFNPRAPCGARRDRHPWPQAPVHISTHAPLAGRDRRPDRPSCGPCHFNPRAPCGARLLVQLQRSTIYKISTHAPLAGRDGLKHGRRICYHHFNPRAPCGARR